MSAVPGSGSRAGLWALTVAACCAVLVVTGSVAAAARAGTATVSGLVYDTSSGAGVAGAVVADPAGGPSTTSAADGSFVLSLTPGAYQLTASKDGHAGTYLTTDPAGVSTAVFTVADGQDLVADIGIDPSATVGTVSGRVAAPGGAGPVADATVSVFPDGQASPVASVVTGVDGAFSVSVPAGVYRVFVDADLTGYGSAWYPAAAAAAGGSSVTVAAGQTQAGLTVTLLPGLNPATPTISGTAQVGSSLTAAAGAWGPAPVALSYQWAGDGVPVAGATASTYTLTGAELGRQVTVTVTGTRTGYGTTSRTSIPTGPVAGALSPTPTPSVSGSSVVGYTLTASPGTWGPAPVTLAYQWNSGGTPITGATAATYVTGQADVGAVVTVTVTGAKTGYTTVAKTSVGITITAAGSTLGSGQQLAGTTVLTTGQYSLGITTGLAELDNNGRVVWQPSTTTGGRLIMQADGNLVRYAANGTSVLWQSGTAGNPGATAKLSPDATFAVVSVAGVVPWSNNAVNDRLVSSQSAGTAATLSSGYVLYSPNRSLRLAMQTDGNLVLYNGSTALWNTATNGNTGARLVLQADGNLVVYRTTNTAVWNAGTSSATAGDRRLLVQNDGNLVLYNAANTAVWSTGTHI